MKGHEDKLQINDLFIMMSKENEGIYALKGSSCCKNDSHFQFT